MLQTTHVFTPFVSSFLRSYYGHDLSEAEIDYRIKRLSACMRQWFQYYCVLYFPLLLVLTCLCCVLEVPVVMVLERMWCYLVSWVQPLVDLCHDPLPPYGSWVLFALELLHSIHLMHRPAHFLAAEAGHKLFGFGVRVGFRRDSNCLRSTFNSTPMPKLREVTSHTHGDSAANRSEASEFASRFAAGCGLIPYFYQCSSSDLRHHRLGSREHYWVKDLSCPEIIYDPPENSLLVMIDVDQYVDMPSVLASCKHPVLLYTFQPHTVAHVSTEVSFTFNARNEVEYRVTGGGHYTHAVWNYQQDHMTALSSDSYAEGTYLVDRKGMAIHHELVLLSPLTYCDTIVHHPEELGGRLLKRFDIVKGQFLRLMSFSREGGMTVSTGRVNEFNYGVTTVEVDNAIASQSRTAKLGLTQAHVQQHMSDDRVAPAVVYEYYKSTTKAVADVVFPVEDALHSYQFQSHSGNYDFDAKDSMVPFMNPIMMGAYAPDRSEGNEQRAIDERVIKVASDVTATPVMLVFMREFVEQLIPVPHQLHPVSIDEVFARQPKPSQQAILNQAVDLYEQPRVAKTFLKAETYPDCKDPRIITTYNGNDKLQYSRYCYTYADDVLHHTPWYAFSRTPRATAERVMEICQNAKWGVVNSDFSRFDGHVSPLLRELELMILQRAFAPAYHDQITELHRAQYGLVAYGQHGSSYNMGTARGSGSSETSCMNSTAGAFHGFVALRSTRAGGQILSPFYNAAEAYARLGINGGDDGLIADVSPDAMKKAALAIGQVTTCELVERGKFGVKFLARVYGPLIWSGAPDSCCDLPRQLGKFHVTGHMDVTPLEKLLEKARSFALTDSNTPVIGQFVSAVIDSRFGIPIDPLAQLARWGTLDSDPDIQYPNEDYDDWMEFYADNALPGFRFEEFYAWIRAGRAQLWTSYFLQPPLCLDPPVPLPKPGVILDGTIPNPKATVPEQSLPGKGPQDDRRTATASRAPPAEAGPQPESDQRKRSHELWLVREENRARKKAGLPPLPGTRQPWQGKKEDDKAPRAAAPKPTEPAALKPPRDGKRKPKKKPNGASS